MSKVCKRCGKSKFIEDFYTTKNSVGKAYPYPNCIPCHRIINKEYYEAHKEIQLFYSREHALQRKYGISSEEYESTLKNQNYGCAICNSLDPCEGRKYFCVDHDHVTGNIRGLLCSPCNKLLGWAFDNPQTLRNAANYVEKGVISNEGDG